MYSFQLRPLDFGEIMDAGFKLFAKHFKKSVTIAAIIMVPIILINLAAFQTAPFEDFLSITDNPESFTSEELLSATLGLLGVVGGTSVLTLLATALIMASLIRVFADAYEGTEHTWQQSLRFGLKRTPALLAAVFLTSLSATFGLVFCIAPGVWLWASWYVTTPALIAERLGPIAAMGRSFNLVKTRFWPTLGLGVVVWLLTFIVGSSVSSAVSLGTIPATFSGEAQDLGAAMNQSVIISTIASSLVQIITLPFAAAMATVVYFDLRVRSEGFDLDRLVAELNGAEPPPPPVDPTDPFGLGGPGAP